MLGVGWDNRREEVAAGYVKTGIVLELLWCEGG